MERHDERRHYARVQLCAYGINKVCIGMAGQERCSLDLVDISAGGARLKLKSGLAESVGKDLILSVQGVQDGGRLQNLAAHIRWRDGQEIGVQFKEQLGIALSELQRIIS